MNQPQVTMNVEQNDVESSFVPIQFFEQQIGDEHSTQQVKRIDGHRCIDDALHFPFIRVLNQFVRSNFGLFHSFS